MNRLLIALSMFYGLLMISLSPSTYAKDQLWTPLTFTSSNITSSNKKSQAKAMKQHENGAFFDLDKGLLSEHLSNADSINDPVGNSEIELPLADGVVQRFKLQESPIMAKELYQRYPDIKNYKIYGIDDPAASGRLSVSRKGFRGMITTEKGRVYIDPVSNDGASNTYRAWSRSELSSAPEFKCGVDGHNHDHPLGVVAHRSAMRTPGSLRVYRLALAATAEYVNAVGGSGNDAAKKAAALIEVNNAINRVNEIYETDLGIRLELIANTDDLFYTDSAADPYTNSNGLTMLSENQSNIDAVININNTQDNYDIGHVFSTGGGGIATVGGVCTANKAEGVTGLNNPTGENFYIDFVAHEIGHQFSAEHTFNGTTLNCGSGNRIDGQAFEPGSGSTIMSYVGICSNENIQSNADAMFHAGSIELIDAFTTTGSGSSCGSPVDNSNPTEPVVDAGNDYTIPRSTPFILSAVASDGDGDTVTYAWDQMDVGTATTQSTFGFDLVDNALFRSYLPRLSNRRHFPTLGTTLQNKFDDSEVLACHSRSIDFRLTVRDGKSGIARDDVRVTVENAVGPFALTSHKTAQTVNPGSVNITWDVADTDSPPVSCTSVDISLLTFDTNKTTYFETILVSGETNDGSATVTIPDNSSSQARFKIQCSNNIFYDVSDDDLIINGASAFPTTGNSVVYNTNGDGFTLFPDPAEICVTTGSTSPGDESNNDFTTATTISFDTNNDFGIQGSSDFDFFLVNVPSTGDLVINTSGTTNTICRFYSDASFSSLVNTSDDLSPTNVNCQLIQDNVAAGNYYISVEGYLDATGDYTLTASFTGSGTTGGGNNSSGSGGSFGFYWIVFMLMLSMARYSSLQNLERKQAVKQLKAGNVF